MSSHRMANGQTRWRDHPVGRVLDEAEALAREAGLDDGSELFLQTADARAAVVKYEEEQSTRYDAE